MKKMKKYSCLFFRSHEDYNQGYKKRTQDTINNLKYYSQKLEDNGKPQTLYAPRPSQPIAQPIIQEPLGTD